MRQAADKHSIRDVILFPHMRPERPVSGGQQESKTRGHGDDTFLRVPASPHRRVSLLSYIFTGVS